MILYDKNGLFLGMGNQELYLLGYEDMEEFRNYHNDFADLLVNKPGYIFKFKNFSWIDYAQHSGTPNKRILIRTKNGKEIETSLTIHEIFLQKEINGSSLLFSIELNNTPFKNELPIPMDTSEYLESKSEEPSKGLLPFEETFTEDVPTSFETAVNFDSLSSFATPLITEDYSEPLEETQTILDDIKPPIDNSFDFKLKFDHSILEEPKAIVVENQENTPEQYESIDQIKVDDLDFVEPIENYVDDKHEDLQKDQNLFVEELRETTVSSSEKDFDLSECAEYLGLDISTLAHILEEYISSLDTAMPLLIEAIHANNRVNAKEEITKLKSIALHLQIFSLYHQFEHLETSLDFDSKNEIVHTFDVLQKEVNDFKENIL